jgi:hypothetical protein
MQALRLAGPGDRRPASAPPAGITQWEGLYVPAWNAVPSLAWVDTLFNVVDVRWDGTHLQLAPLQGKSASLYPAGGMLFRGSDRIEPSHALLVSEGARMLSDGLRNYRQVPVVKMLWLWTSAAFGLAGLSYVLVRGVWLLARGQLRRTSTLAVPLAAVILLLAPIPLFLRQSFLQLGDLTVASGLLAFATAALPVGIAYGLVGLLTRTHRARHPALDCAALLAVTQWMIVLAAWGHASFRAVAMSERWRRTARKRGGSLRLRIEIKWRRPTPGPSPAQSATSIS